MSASAARSIEPRTYRLDQDEVARLAAGIPSIAPWRGLVPAGRSCNFLGVLRPLEAPNGHPERQVETRLPRVSDGESFSEWYSTSHAIARAAKRFTMVSLGAHYGGPLVNAVALLRAVRPMPYRLVAIEGDPNMCAMMTGYMRESRIGQTALTLINAVIGPDNKPVLFPCSATRTGANSAVSSPAAIQSVVRAIKAAGHEEAALNCLLNEGTTGLFATLGGTDVQAELRMMSSLTLGDVLGPIDHVDYLEIDIQSAEYRSLPPFIDLIRRRVGWLHLGTHGDDVHEAMATLFRTHGFRVEIDWYPESSYETPEGAFRTQDGVLAVANPDFD